MIINRREYLEVELKGMNSISLLDLSKMTQKFCILMLLESSIDLFGYDCGPYGEGYSDAITCFVTGNYF